MKSIKISILIGLVIPIVFTAGIITGWMPQVLTNNIHSESTNIGTYAQDEPQYIYDDFVIIANGTYYGPHYPYPGIISGNCALIYAGIEDIDKNVSLHINGLFYSTGTSIKSITICHNPWLVYSGWFFGAWNTSSYDNGKHELTVYVDNEEVASTFVYIKN